MLPTLLSLLQTTIQYLTPVLHTLNILLLSLTSVALKASYTLLSSIPPSFTPLVILATLLFALYVFLALTRLVRRATAWILGLFVRLWMLGFVLGMGYYVKEHGLQHSLNQLGWLLGLLKGWWDEGWELGDQRAREVGRRGHAAGGAAGYGMAGRDAGGWW